MFLARVLLISDEWQLYDDPVVWLTADSKQEGGPRNNNHQNNIKLRDKIDNRESGRNSKFKMKLNNWIANPKIDICYHVFQHGIIARRLSTHKVPHLTKPTSKTTCTKRNGPKAIQEQVYFRTYLTHEPTLFATREPGQPSVQGWGMTTISHTDPDNDYENEERFINALKEIL
ncbi:hypothetical protein LXL04_031333 [Taraxacum kok-saghyz]